MKIVMNVDARLTTTILATLNALKDGAGTGQGRNRMNKTNELLKEFEELCKFVREVHSDDTVCGYCEYDCGAVGEEPMECPGFETDECFKLKEEFKKKYLGETE